jgi:hypothetical protein
MAVKGYSERGIFNSIVYFLDDNENHIYDFLKVLGISLANGDYEYTFLIEQSFSDFGDSDLIIIIIDKNTKERVVVFVEGKVKTYQGKFKLKAEFEKINNLLNNSVKNGKIQKVSSNLFVQLYYKNLLITTHGKGNPYDKPVFLKTDRKTKTRSICRQLGNNNIVRNAFNKYIDNANDYYYVAILPEKNINITDMQDYVKRLELMPYDKVRCCWWGDIEKFFNNINAKKVTDVFNFNKDGNSQIY